jgi:coiled-coil and C2 domain-containing protein 2A
MELEELQSKSPIQPHLTTEVTPFHRSPSPIPSNASGSQEADEMMRSMREKRLQRKEQLQTTIKATVHYPPRLPPLKHEGSPESRDFRPPLLTKPIANGEEMKESGDARIRKEHRSKELTESIRQRMRQKLQEANWDMADDETGDRQKPTRRLRALRPREVPTRFDEPVGASLASESGFTLDRTEAEDQLQSRHSSALLARSRWQQAIDSTMLRKSVSSREKDFSYHFFTQSLEEPFEELFPQCASVIRDEPDAGATAVSGDVAVREREELEGEQPTDELDTSALIETGQLEDEEAQYGALTMKGYPSYEPHFHVLKQESELYFIPSTESMRVEDRLPGQDPPRYLAEEGIYVGKRPRVSFANYNRMENRLIQQDDKGKSWFAEDGRLAYLPDPLKKPPSRPHIWRDSQTVIQTDYKLPREETFDSQFIDGSGTGGGRYQLDVDVSTLQFSHHSLFSAEHVKASQLTQLYTQFCDRQKKETTQFLTDKLKALKEAAYHLEETLGPVEPVAGTGLDEQFQRLKEYKYEIRQVRQFRDTQELADKTLLKSIFKCWNELKALREQQGYNNTSLKLVAKKTAVSTSEDQAKWRSEIDEEIIELRELYEEEYNQLVLEYHQEMETYKRQKKAIRKELRRRQHQAQSSANAAEGDETTTIRDDGTDDSVPLCEPTKPEPPVPFNEDQVRQEVTEKAQRNRRLPGHPILLPIMDNSVGITPTHQCPREEQLRRRDVQRTSYYIRVQFNGKEVSRTSTRHLGGDFSVHFGEIFNVQIRQWPETITLQVYESLGSGSHTLLSDIYVAIPPPQLHSANVNLESVDFSSSLEVQHDHAAVGSGVEMNPTLGNLHFLLTSGSLKCSVCWSHDDNGKVLCPPLLSQPTRGLGGAHQTDAVAALGAAGMVDIRKLAAWIAEAKLDPNDPRNADLLYLVKTHAGDDPACLAKQDYFRLSELEKDTHFCSDEDLDENKRFRLIQLRDQEMQDFSTYKMIPINDAEIKDSVFKDVEKKLDEGAMDERKSRKMAVTKFFRDVQDRVIERSKKASKKRELRDVVIEEEVPDIRLLGASIAKLLEPKRPLKPERKERKTIFAQVGGVSDIKLLVRVVRAFDVPIRQSHSDQATEQRRPLPQRYSLQQSRTTRILDEEGSEPASNNDVNLMKMEFAQQVQVRPFVEVTFQQQTCVTPVVDGPNPSWNAELTIPFTSPNNDYSPTGLQTVPDEIYFNLFDELLIDVLEDDRERATTRHERIERRWLGSFSIPFSTVYSNTRVDGTFQLSVPPILLGYTQDTYASQRTSGPTAFDLALDSHQQTFLSLFLTIEPPLPPLPPLREQFDSNEDPNLLRNCQLWRDSLIEKFKRRQIDVRSHNGVCCTVS